MVYEMTTIEERIALFDALDEEMQEYLLHEPGHIDEKCVRLLEFENGQKGAIIVYGEASAFVLFVGNRVITPNSYREGNDILHEREISEFG